MAKKILIIDDEIDFCEMVQDHLNLLGYEAVFAVEAEEGLRLVKSEKPDLVFLDVMMPGTSGLECLEAIKAAMPETIVVMLSGMSDEATAKSAIAKGAYDYITKPFDMDYLESSVLNRIFPAD